MQSDTEPDHAAAGRGADGPARILYTIPNFVTAGSGQAMANVIERLDQRRFEPWVAVEKEGGDLFDHLVDIGVPVQIDPFTVPATPYSGLPARVWRASRAFAGKGFRIQHSFHYSDDYTEPLIARAAGTRSWVYTKKNMSWGGNGWRLRSLLASRIATQNEAMISRFYRRPLLHGRVRMIRTGIDIDGWRPDGTDTSDLLPGAVSADDVIATCVGHIQPRKNQLALVKAAERVPGLQVLLAGNVLDDEYGALLRTECERRGVSDRVHFLGPVDDVAGLLHASDVFVLPAHAEGAPIAVLEAMAAGLPVVVSDIPGVRDLIGDGDEGFRVDVADDDQWATRLKQLVQDADLRRRMSEQSLRTVSDRASIEIEVARYESLYTELLS